MARHVLVTGGTRSGKSKYAEEIAVDLGGRIVYLATAEVKDAEMRERIERHRQRRPAEWVTVEEPYEVSAKLSKYQSGDTVLIDCLTLYLSNLFFKYQDLAPQDQERIIQGLIGDLANNIDKNPANVIVVSNEIGWGVVPDNDLARRFRDLAGLANQTVANVCNEVYLVVSGIPVLIKGGQDVQKP